MARTAKKEKALTPEEKLAQALVPDVEQPYRVPDNWCWTTMDRVAQWGSGGTPSRGNPSFFGGNIPWVKTGELNDDYIFYTEETLSEDGLTHSSAKLFPINTIIIAMYGATVGKVGILGIEAATNQACACGKCSSAVDYKYLYFYARSQKDIFIDKARGGAQPNISQEIIKSHPIPIPPITEQQRIVDCIESLFAKLDEAKEKAQVVVDGFEDRKAAILHKAFTGELTAEWRKSFNGADWERSILGTYLKPMETKKPAGERFLYIDIDSIDNKRQEVRAPKDTLVKEAPSRASRAVHHGDVLFSMVRPYLKNIALIDESLQECIASTGFYVCTPKSGLDSKYLYYLLCSKDAIDYLMQFMKGDNSPSIRKDDLLNMQIMLPSNQEQIQIVQILDDALEHEQQAKEAAEQVIDQIDSMKKSILARAFRGELGTNDPADESAVELLKRVLRDDVPAPQRAKPVKMPKDLSKSLRNDMEKKIIKLYFQRDAMALSVKEIMSVSSKTFEVLDCLRSLQNRQIITKQEDGNYRLMG